MIRHYAIMKHVVCDLTGEFCGEYVPMKSSAIPACETCTVYIDWKKRGGSPEEYYKQTTKELNEWYLSTRR